MQNNIFVVIWDKDFTQITKKILETFKHISVLEFDVYRLSGDWTIKFAAVLVLSSGSRNIVSLGKFHRMKNPLLDD